MKLLKDAGLSLVCVIVLGVAVVLWNSSRLTVEKLATQRDELKQVIQTLRRDFESSRAVVLGLDARIESLQASCRALREQFEELARQRASTQSSSESSGIPDDKSALATVPAVEAVLGQVPDYLSFEDLDDQEQAALRASRTALFRRTASGSVSIFNCDNTKFKPTPEQRDAAIELANVMNELVDSEWLFALEEFEKRDPNTFCWVDAPEAEEFNKQVPPPVLVELHDKRALVNTSAWHSSGAIGELKERRKQLSADHRLPCMFWVVTVE
ncbi:MAG: hypothetical protein ACKVX7_19870 [Planctomycetota bacterium]